MADSSRLKVPIIAPRGQSRKNATKREVRGQYFQMSPFQYSAASETSVFFLFSPQFSQVAVAHQFATLFIPKPERE